MRKWIALALLAAVGVWFWFRRREPEALAPFEPPREAQPDEQRIVLPPWAAPETEATVAAISQPDEETRVLDGAPPADETAMENSAADLLTTETATIQEIAQAELAANPLAEVSALAAAATEAAGDDSQVNGYCVRCKDQRPMLNTRRYITANKRPALRGECAVCGAGMFKFLKE